MKELEFTVSDIKDLMAAFSKGRLGSMKLEQGSFKLELEADTVARVAAAPAMIATAAVPVQEESEPQDTGNVMKAPIVGTFYAAPAPGKPPFAEAGSRVKKGDVLFIIESMKLMNEVASEFDGVVREIHVKDGEAVEYGQPVVTIE